MKVYVISVDDYVHFTYYSPTSSKQQRSRLDVKTFKARFRREHPNGEEPKTHVGTNYITPFNP